MLVLPFLAMELLVCEYVCEVAAPARPVAVAQTQPTESLGEGPTVGC